MEIITIDVYGDKQEIIEDCLEALEPFIDEVLVTSIFFLLIVVYYLRIP